MNDPKTSGPCPSCGAAASGKFCHNCGAPLTGATCSACATPLTPGARFCHLCGAPLGATSQRKGVAPLPWAIAAGAVVILALVIAVRFQSSQPPAQAGRPPTNLAQAPAPDISNMTPREQANRLFDRVMRAVERGDTAEVRFFTPMALQTYGLLGGLDNDARYDVGLIHAVTGNPEAALAQADSLDAAIPGHLLAAVIRHSVAEARDDSAAVQRAYRQFLENYQRESAIDRPEYSAHQRTIESFREEARQATGAPGED